MESDARRRCPQPREPTPACAGWLADDDWTGGEFRWCQQGLRVEKYPLLTGRSFGGDPRKRQCTRCKYKGDYPAGNGRLLAGQRG